MHAIGDEAARMALDVIDEIEVACRPRIEHAQQLHPSDIPRFRGRIASMQPLHKADDCRYVRKRMGDERLAGTFAFQSLSDAGAILAFGSDWPVVSCDPLQGMRAAITGLTFDEKPFGVEQNLSVEQTLRAYTQGAAFALGVEDAGILKIGAVGDLVILDRDPFSADWRNAPPEVSATIAGGQIVYDARQQRDAEVKV
jgi:predicted amidohydrolase YtcJ